MSLDFYCKEEDDIREESINRYRNLFINYDTKTPSLVEALEQMFKSSNLDKKKIDELIFDMINQCSTRIDPDFENIQSKYRDITKEDAYIICSYTCESIDRAYSPYRLLNRSLVANNREFGVNNISKYLYIFLKSLRKLPRYYPENNLLYRCLTIQVDLSQKEDNKSSYRIGNKKTFWGFTSTSTNPNTTYNFLKKKDNESEAMKTGTIFILSGDVWGYNIEPFNFFHEKEILLEPERKYTITNILPPLNGVISINCDILKTNLVLSDKIESNMSSYDNTGDENQSSVDLGECLIKFEMEAKINEEEKYTLGTGILCNIPSKNMTALITFNHMLNSDFLNYGEKMIVKIKRKQLEINIKINRYKYTNEELDITILEILNVDNINIFIDMDKYINSKNYKDVEISSVTFKNDIEFEILNGKITEKNNDNYKCDIKSNKEGMIIIKDSQKLIGLKKENDEIIPMNIILNKINYIKCIYEIKSKDISKEIQIINNKSHFDNEIQNQEIGQEIKVIINGEIKSNIFKRKFIKEGVYTIYFLSYKPITNMSYMFYDCATLQELDFSSFNTNQVNNMTSMLCNCRALNQLKLKSLNTNKVTNMRSMFCNCRSLKEIDLSAFNTEQVTDMSFMFFNCRSLQLLNLSSFNTDQVKSMSYMFSHCSSLKEINLTSFNTNQVTDLSCMFSHCSSLNTLNLSVFDTTKVTDMSCMFHNCSSLKKLDISNFKTSQVNSMTYMLDSINKECKVECKDKQIIEEIKNSTGCTIF